MKTPATQPTATPVKWLRVRALIENARRFLASEDAPTACEYAVLLAAILIAAMAAIQLHGCKLTYMYRNIGRGLPSAS